MKQCPICSSTHFKSLAQLYSTLINYECTVCGAEWETRYDPSTGTTMLNITKPGNINTNAPIVYQPVPQTPQPAAAMYGVPDPPDPPPLKPRDKLMREWWDEAQSFVTAKSDLQRELIYFYLNKLGKRMDGIEQRIEKLAKEEFKKQNI